MTTSLAHAPNIFSRLALCCMLTLLCLALSSCAVRKKTSPTANPEFPTKLVEAAINAYTTGDCKESIKQFNAALLFSNQTSIQNGLGVAYISCNQPQSAIPVLEQAISQSPASAALHTNLGIAFYANGNIKDAKDEFQKALKFDPMYIGAVVGMAGIDIHEEKPEQALRTLFDLEKAYPGILEIAYNKALAYHAMGLPIDAEPLLQSYVDAFPDDAEARNALAIILLANGKLPEARVHLSEAIRLYPIEGSYYYNRGNLLRENGNFKEAEADYNRAIAFLPEMPEAYANRGDLRFLLQNTKGACKDLEKACSLSPEFCTRYKSYQTTGRCPRAL